MPTTYNGIGTWYWGKRNIVTRSDRCDICGAHALLSSYDTTLYFVVVFLPLIPLGGRRVIDECPRCRKHRAMSLRKWEKLKIESLMEALDAWQADRGNADKASKAVGVTVAYQDRQAFDDLAPAVREAFTRNADVQLFLAAAHDHFGQTDQAESAYREAVAIRNDAPTRRELAKFLLRQLRPDEAQPLLADILTTKDTANSSLLLGLAQTYQATGNHEAAAKLLEEMGTAFPNLLSDAEYERIRRVSTKYRGTNKRIKVEGLDTRRRTGARESNWFQRNAAAAVIAIIVAGAGAWYFSVAAHLANHKVQIVNGSAVNYTVEIAGQKRSVPAKSATTIDLKEGSYTVIVPDHPEIDPAKIDLKTNLWTRPLDRRVFVINPDRTAVLFERVVPYSVDQSATADVDPPKYYVGTALYNFKQADDVFVQPPSSVKLPNKSAVVKRRHIDLVRDVPLAMLPDVLEEQFGADAATNWLKRSVLTGGENMVLLGLLANQLSPAELIAFIRPHLGDRPLRIEWHRIYQEMMQREHPEYDLTAEYQAMLAKNPEDSTLMYLTARVLPDRTAAEAMFTKAAEAPVPSAYAMYALAYDDMNELRFDKALLRVREARKLDPVHLKFLSLEGEALEALRRFDEALALNRSQQKHDGHDHATVADEIRLLVSKGDPAAAQERIELYCQELDKLHDGDKTMSGIIRNLLNAQYAYARNDMPAYRSALNQLDGSPTTWQAAAIDGKFADAEKWLAEQKDADVQQYLTLAALAHSDKAVADRAWAKVKELMLKRDRDDRAFVARLNAAGANGPTDEDLNNWRATTPERCLMLTCLGQRYPQQRQSLHATAAKLNFSTRFPHHQLTAVLAAKP